MPDQESFFREQMLASQARIERSVEDLRNEVRSANAARVALELDHALLRQRVDIAEKAAAAAAKVAAENKNMSLSALLGIISAVSVLISAFVGVAWEAAKALWHGHAP